MSATTPGKVVTDIHRVNIQIHCGTEPEANWMIGRPQLEEISSDLKELIVRGRLCHNVSLTEKKLVAKLQKKLKKPLKWAVTAQKDVMHMKRALIQEQFGSEPEAIWMLGRPQLAEGFSDLQDMIANKKVY